MTPHLIHQSKPCDSITGKRQSGLPWSYINGKILPMKPRGFWQRVGRFLAMDKGASSSEDQVFVPAASSPAVSPVPASIPSATTPGPWEHVRLSGVCGPNAIRMPYNNTQTFYGVREIARTEDARLISAAPDLLNALVELRDWYVAHTGMPACNANAAIAKALGKQK